jgi:adenine phosphoribosyltransferase
MSEEIAQNAVELKAALQQFPNFPQEGILFEDFLPIFRTPALFKKLVRSFKLHIESKFPGKKIDYVVGLESRGFLFGPTLALELDAGFVPVRKAGKLPGKVESATYVKEYGQDVFEIQSGAIPKGATVIIVDDIIATGGSAAAAGELVNKTGANLLEFLFVLELDFLKGTEKLSAPSFTLLSGQTEKLSV